MLIFFLMKYRFFFNLWQHWSTNFILFNINQQQQNSREFEKSLAWILEIDRTKTFLSVDIRFFVARKSSLLVCTHTGWKSRGESSSSFWQNPGGGGLWGASRLICPPPPPPPVCIYVTTVSSICCAALSPRSVFCCYYWSKSKLNET
jgi:hypothetical protein